MDTTKLAGPNPVEQQGVLIPLPDDCDCECGTEGCYNITDYRLQPDASSTWVEVGNIVVHIIIANIDGEDGVVVELFPNGNEGSDPLDVAMATCSESELQGGEYGDESCCSKS